MRNVNGKYRPQRVHKKKVKGLAGSIRTAGSRQDTAVDPLDIVQRFKDNTQSSLFGAGCKLLSSNFSTASSGSEKYQTKVPGIRNSSGVIKMIDSRV